MPQRLFAVFLRSRYVDSQETFGPVVAITPFDGSEAAAVELSNDTGAGDSWRWLGWGVWLEVPGWGVDHCLLAQEQFACNILAAAAAVPPAPRAALPDATAAAAAPPPPPPPDAALLPLPS